MRCPVVVVAPCPTPLWPTAPCVRGTGVVRCLRPKREVRAGRTGRGEREKRERRGAVVVVWCVIVGYVGLVWFDL